MGSLAERLLAFMFPAESDRWLSVLRVGLGLQVTLYTLSSRADWNELFAKTGQGLVNRELAEAFLSVQSVFAPRISWLIGAGNYVSLNEETVLWSAWTCLLCVGCCLIIGFFSRAAAVIAWFIHLCAVGSEELLSYGMDNLTTIGLFYLMLSPLPDRLSLDSRLRKAAPANTTLNGFFRRVLQLHVCIIYFFGGITKAVSVDWWNGNSIWRALTSPPYDIVSPQVLLAWKYFLPLTGIVICVIETGYPFFIWWKRTRLVWLVCACGVHLAIACAMGLYLFSLIMIILNLSAFGPGLAFARWSTDVSTKTLPLRHPT